MKNRRRVLVVVLLLTSLLLALPMPAAALDLEQELLGVWSGTFLQEGTPWFPHPNRLTLTFVDRGGRLAVSIDKGSADKIPGFYPVKTDGDTFSFRVPLAVVVEGQLVDGKLTGTFAPARLSPSAVYSGPWQAERFPLVPVLPLGPGPDCGHIPGPNCEGTEEYCGELVLFEPIEHEAWWNYPINGETWDDQYRSYIRRDVMMLVQYAAAMTRCQTESWSYGNMAPMGLGDMSEADGAIPGTSIGSPGHPPGTHTNGLDIDVGYYQLYTEDNMLREICDSSSGRPTESHCVGEPYGMDPYRNALFISHLAEHPRFRVIGADGKAGPILELALDELVSKGWIDADLRASIPLAYEVENQGWGWYYHHHHHMHISWKAQASGSASSMGRPSQLTIAQ